MTNDELMMKAVFVRFTDHLSLSTKAASGDGAESDAASV
jgi:hypothetical protein